MSHKVVRFGPEIPELHPRVAGVCWFENRGQPFRLLTCRARQAAKTGDSNSSQEIRTDFKRRQEVSARGVGK